MTATNAFPLARRQVTNHTIDHFCPTKIYRSVGWCPFARPVVVVRFGGEVPLDPIASGACSARSPPIAVDMPSEDPETRGVAEGDPVDETLFVVRPPPSWAHSAFPFPSRLTPGLPAPSPPP